MRTRGYFQILEDAHEGSMPPSPSPSSRGTPRAATPTGIGDDMLEGQELPGTGYYERYFREEGKLGMGAEGSVFLATHIIEGNVLGKSKLVGITNGRNVCGQEDRRRQEQVVSGQNVARGQNPRGSTPSKYRYVPSLVGGYDPILQVRSRWFAGPDVSALDPR